MNFQDLRFLTDENIDKELVEFLLFKNFDVWDIKATGNLGLSDREILDISFQEQRVIISQDSDFGKLIFQENVPFWGLIYLRPGHYSYKIHLETLQALLESPMYFEYPFILVAEHHKDVIKLRLRLLAE